MYTTLNLRFRENRKKKINKLLLIIIIIIIKNCRNLAALRRSLSFFEADDLILIGVGDWGWTTKFVEASPVSSIFFCLNVFGANVRLITQRMIYYYYYFKPEYRIIIIMIIIIFMISPDLSPILSSNVQLKCIYYSLYGYL